MKTIEHTETYPSSQVLDPVKIMAAMCKGRNLLSFSCRCDSSGTYFTVRYMEGE